MEDCDNPEQNSSTISKMEEEPNWNFESVKLETELILPCDDMHHDADDDHHRNDDFADPPQILPDLCPDIKDQVPSASSVNMQPVVRLERLDPNLLAALLTQIKKEKTSDEGSSEDSAVLRCAITRGPDRKKLLVDLTDPIYHKPFDFGWKREVVHRLKGGMCVYYFTPCGKKLRSTREVLKHLDNPELSLDNFTYCSMPLGINDPSKECIRKARLRDGTYSENVRKFARGSYYKFKFQRTGTQVSHKSNKGIMATKFSLPNSESAQDNHEEMSFATPSAPERVLSKGPDGKFLLINLSDPIYRKPFELGWKRHVVYGYVKGMLSCKIRYDSPSGKRILTSKQVKKSLIGPELSMDNFTFCRYPLGINDSNHEIVRSIIPQGTENPAKKTPSIVGKKNPKRVTRKKISSTSPESAPMPSFGGLTVKFNGIKTSSMATQLAETETDSMGTESIIPKLEPAEDNSEAVNLAGPSTSTASVPKEVTPETKKKKSTNLKHLDPSDPIFRKPFNFGWKRVVAYGSIANSVGFRRCNIYYFSPTGKRVQSVEQLQPLLTDSNLSVDHFFFGQVPLGLNDSKKEIILHGKKQFSKILAKRLHKTQGRKPKGTVHEGVKKKRKAVDSQVPPSSHKSALKSKKTTTSKSKESAVKSIEIGTGPTAAESSSSEPKPAEDGHEVMNAEISTTPIRISRGPDCRKLIIDLSDPMFRIPFDFGWKRMVVYRQTMHPKRRPVDIYYVTPTGKKLRSCVEVKKHITEPELSLDNFTYYGAELGVQDSSKEIIRQATLRKVHTLPKKTPKYKGKATTKLKTKKKGKRNAIGTLISSSQKPTQKEEKSLPSSGALTVKFTGIRTGSMAAEFIGTTNNSTAAKSSLPESKPLEDNSQVINPSDAGTSTSVTAISEAKPEPRKGRRKSSLRPNPTFLKPLDIGNSQVMNPSDASTSTSETASSEATPKPQKGRRKNSVNLSDPMFLKPFDFGWKREVSYRPGATPGKHMADVYYLTPTKKRLRSLEEVKKLIINSELKTSNFCFHKRPLGINDPTKEIIRTARQFRTPQKCAKIPHKKVGHGRKAETTEVSPILKSAPKVVLEPLDFNAVKSTRIKMRSSAAKSSLLESKLTEDVTSAAVSLLTLKDGSDTSPQKLDVKIENSVAEDNPIHNVETPFLFVDCSGPAETESTMNSNSPPNYLKGFRRRSQASKPTSLLPELGPGPSEANPDVPVESDKAPNTKKNMVITYLSKLMMRENFGQFPGELSEPVLENQQTSSEIVNSVDPPHEVNSPEGVDAATEDGPVQKIRKKRSQQLEPAKTIKKIKLEDASVCQEDHATDSDKSADPAHLGLDDSEVSVVENDVNFDSKGPSPSFSSEQSSQPSESAENSETQSRNFRNTRKMFCCTKCPTICASKFSIRRHVKQHSDKKLPLPSHGKYFSCGECSAKFKAKEDLKKHLLTHCDLFSCELCSRRFMSKSLLQSHLDTHFDVRPFSLDECST